MKNLLLIALASALAVSTGCSLEHTKNILGPTPGTAQAASPMTTGSNAAARAQSMIGAWKSATRFSTRKIISESVFSSCGDFEWTVTSQTATEASGHVTAVCAGGVNIEGTITAQLGGTTMPLIFNGTANLGTGACGFSLDGVGVPLGNDTFQIDYTGTTCLGPVRGTEILRLGSSAPASEPAPEPTPPPAPTEPEPAPTPAPSVFHVGPGPISADRAKDVVSATSNEFPHLTAVMGSDQAALAAADELLGRTIWHLQLAGFQAARQRNPSGAISSDKLSVVIDGRWHVYDIFSLGGAGRATRVQWLEVPLPNPVGNDGIPD